MKRLLVALTLSLPAFGSNPQFTEWSPPVNMGPVVNSPYQDSCITVSKNGLSMFFFSNRYAQNPNAIWHLYVSRRASVEDPWGVPQEIAGFNSGYHATCPALSPDEHRLFYVDYRSGGPAFCGGGDIVVSRRHDRRDDFGWGPPVNLGCAPNGPNSPQWDSAPTVIEDETGTEVMYFSSYRPGGTGASDIYESRMRNDGTFGPAVQVTELNTPYNDVAAVRRDGLEAILQSNRPGGNYPGTLDNWVSTRARTGEPWSAPVPVPVLNSAATDGGRACFSFDGRTFYFLSDRPGGQGNRDIYYATREKLRQ